MPDISGWHASPRRGAPTSSTHTTGEVRIPLSLYQLDQHQGDTSLVLSRAEAEALVAELTAHLGISAALADAQ